MFREFVRDLLPPLVKRKYWRLKKNFEFNNYPYKNLLKANEELKNTKLGKNAFLFATGPSINLENLNVLKGQDCFSLSNFFLHKDIELLKPIFHFFAPYHHPLIIENYIDWLNLADKKLPAETNIFLSTRSYEMVNKYKLFPKRKIKYLYFSTFEYVNYDIDISKPVLGPQSSPIMILPVLFYMGYENIYLLGCDHTWLKDYKKTTQNFYDKSEDIRESTADSLVSEDNDMLSQLEAVRNLFLQYKYYKKISDEKGKPQIINLSKESWLDLFQNENLEDLELDS